MNSIKQAYIAYVEQTDTHTDNNNKEIAKKKKQMNIFYT